ncbi:uncharacterized protein LOC142467954 isoform X2 [Ascaphus truei]
MCPAAECPAVEPLQRLNVRFRTARPQRYPVSGPQLDSASQMHHTPLPRTCADPRLRGNAASVWRFPVPLLVTSSRQAGSLAQWTQRTALLIHAHAARQTSAYLWTPALSSTTATDHDYSSLQCLTTASTTTYLHSPTLTWLHDPDSAIRPGPMIVGRWLYTSPPQPRGLVQFVKSSPSESRRIRKLSTRDVITRNPFTSSLKNSIR